jgi:phage tail-like protein
MSTTTTFTGFSPEQQAGRSFDLWKFIPAKNKREDLTKDLERFIRCLDEIVQLQLVQIDHFTDLFDPDICSDQVIDDMLLDMGNPFDWAELELTATQRRKLLRLLIEIYKSKGTAIGIENTILLLLGIDILGTVGFWEWMS